MLKKFKKIAAATVAIMMMASTFSIGASAQTYRGYQVLGSTGGYKSIGKDKGTFNNRITQEGLFISTACSSTGICEVKNISYIKRNLQTGSTSSHTLKNDFEINEVMKSKVFTKANMSKYIISSSTSTHRAYKTLIIKNIKTAYGVNRSYFNL